jgi:hypothetical protein
MVQKASAGHVTEGFSMHPPKTLDSVQEGRMIVDRLDGHGRDYTASSAEFAKSLFCVLGRASLQAWTELDISR